MGLKYETGMSIQFMVQQLSNPVDKSNSRVCRKNFTTWQHEYIFDGIRGVHYGKSFCNKFGITDNILFFSADPDFCNRYISKNYIKKEKNITQP